MARIIPNEQSWIAFRSTLTDYTAPSATELADATVLTKYVVSINATSQGNAIPTPALDSLFDRSIIGTSQGQFQADLYRDDAGDDAWNLLPRATTGFFLISRYGGLGTGHMPEAGQEIEVWPVQITSRAGSNMTSNTVQTFTLTAAVPEVPSEAAIVSAAAGAVPTAPRNLVGVSTVTGEVVLDFDAPASGGPLETPLYAVFMGTTAQAAQEAVSAETADISGTTAILTGLSGTKYFCVAAHNALGDGARTASIAVVVHA